jgi:D-alanyl-D-alanine carboxypeptidase
VKIRLAGLLMLGLLSACARETTAEASAAGPSPVRVQLDRFLEVFNSGDAARLREFARTHASRDYDSRAYVDLALQLHKQFGGFDLLEAEEVRPSWIKGWVRARDSDAVMELKFDVDPFPPHEMTFVDFGWGDPPRKYLPVHVTEAEAVRALRDEARRRTEAGKFSGAVLLARGDQVLLREAYGLADREKNIANTIDTRFRTASVSKMFTAVAVLRLVQEGKLGLEDRIGKIVPELAEQPVSSATVSQLLSHTSGAGDFFGPTFIKHRNEIRTHDDFVKFFARESLHFRPGEKYGYSNLGYIWLGTAIERVSGQPYHEYVRKTVLEPAGMKYTDYPEVGFSMDGRALGYERPAGTREWKSAMEHLRYRGDGAGGAFSTVDDLARFVAALHGHRLLDEKHVQLLTESRVEAWTHRGVGYGVFIETNPWLGLGLGMSGGEPGTSSETWFMPSTGYTLVVLSNFDPNSAAQVAEFARGRLPLL